jgi:hypothetical protein
MPYPSTSLYPSATLYPAVERLNLMPVPSSETGSSLWITTSSTNAFSTDTAYAGTQSVKVTKTGGTGAIAGGYGSSPATGTPNAEILSITTGLSYTFSYYVATGAASVTSRARIHWYSNSAFISTSEGTSTALTAGPWERRSVTATAPANATRAALAFDGTLPASSTMYFDGFLFEQSASLGTYFDGSSVNSGFGYSWAGTSNDSVSSEIAAGYTIASDLSGSGTLTSAMHRYIASGLSGSGTLTSSLHRYIASALSGEGSLTSSLGRVIASDFAGSGALTSEFHRYIQSSLSGSGTLSSTLLGYQEIDSQFSGSGTLTSSLVVGVQIASDFTGTGTLQSILTLTPRFNSHFGGEGVLYSELGYVVTPPALGSTPLGKLVSFNVSTSAVPLNPAEGSGATPSVSIGYVKGTDPEYAIGETNVLSHGAVGTYEGEIVRLSLPEGSDVASVSQDTLLTLLNTDLHLFPFIDAAPSTWTAARAIDYWSQQCGLFYDKVPGDCIAYASGYGHTDSYGADTTSRFYENLAGGATSTTVLNNRSVKTLGSAVTGTTAFHELPEGRVSVSVPKNRKLVASIGLGLRGTGRTATATWNMIDAQDASHSITVSATSAGAVSASVGGVPVTSTSVSPNGDYRITFSIERVSSTAVVGKLTVHTDDLDGTGTLVYASNATVASYALPTVAYLTSITHVSAGGSGAEMLRWGTFLSVTVGHPMELPAVQKTLSQTPKDFGFVSGFEGNVWAMLNEFCAIARLDVSFLESRLMLTPRSSSLSVPVGNFSRFGYDTERREKYKQVAVMNKQSVANMTGTAVLWRADSVFQVAAREVFETTVQTAHSILSLVQPVAVDGIWPFPYTAGAGEYVVTGADGYIIAPAWWNDNGGLVEVSLTGKEGEIAIKITAPALDTVRAPYRISEGAADRPALYVSGSGILNDPKEVHVGTGAKNAKEGFDNVFESPFIAGVMEAYDTAVRMAAEYSASMADVSFELPNDFYTPSRFGQYPSGTRFTDGKRNYRIMSASQTHNKVSGNAVPHTTIGDYVASYPAGSTIADEKARHTGATIKQFNIKPLRGSDETA